MTPPFIHACATIALYFVFTHYSDTNARCFKDISAKSLYIRFISNQCISVKRQSQIAFCGYPAYQRKAWSHASDPGNLNADGWAKSLMLHKIKQELFGVSKINKIHMAHQN